MELLTVSRTNTSYPSNLTAGLDPALRFSDIMQICRERPAGFAVWATVELLSFAVGTPANLRVLWLLLGPQPRGQSSSRSPSHVFYINLAVMDLLFCCITPLHVYNVFFLQSTALLHSLFCLFSLSLYGGPLLYCCICLEHYLAVVHPLALRRLGGSPIRAAMSAGSWAAALGFSLLLTQSGLWDHLGLVGVPFYPCLAVMVFCKLSILRALRETGPGDEGARKRREDEGRESKGEERRTRRKEERGNSRSVKRRAFHTVLAILLVVLTLYLPAAFTVPFYSYAQPHMVFCYLHPLSFSFIILSSVAKPLLYLSRVNGTSCGPVWKAGRCWSQDSLRPTGH